ncbi:MAG: signal peptidase II [Synergistales bacterium]|nr:signal peptidase II [Synergistales bacterium]MDY6402021.1 signal peptidase II [Synergistales bacterium]MDY6404204.1 signal peptidase II [Synergistales bacterium]MDY6411150.1 signal peptidase II [Synergistales bacterium]MDY6413953.1 signal peptidase II [Synergistales bacterium]
MLLTFAIIILCVLIEQCARIFFDALSYNTGAAFSLFSGSPEVILIFSGISCAIIIFLSLFTRINKFTRLGLAIMSGGALSNFLERFFLGCVIDWIPSPLPFLDINFNLADVEISLGALIIVFELGVRR